MSNHNGAGTNHNPAATTGDGPEATAVAAVAGLAREVEGLRRAVAELKDLPRRVDELTAMFARLSTATAAKVSDAGTLTPSWLAMPTDTSEAAAVLGDLLDWMRRVYLRYTDAALSLPECWMWHPDVIEELLWLRYAWRHAYEDEEDTRPHLPGDWHDRQRPGVVRRIKTTAGTCSLDNHLPDGSRHTPAPAVPLAQAYEQLVDWWTHHRDDPAPAPTADHLATAASARPKSRRSRRAEVNPDA
jgi:hypothetical protein